MGKVLFICAGNVARSQMAEAFYNTYSHSQEATSAGTLSHTPSKYKTPIQEVIDVMREEGIDVSSQIVKLVSADMVKNAEKVYVLCGKDTLPEFVANNPNVTYWEITDPFGTTTHPYGNKRTVLQNTGNIRW